MHAFEHCLYVFQPRRISAISVAERVAYERGEEVGESTGYSVRFESVFPRHYGSLFFCTVGKLDSKSICMCCVHRVNVCAKLTLPMVIAHQGSH